MIRRPKRDEELWIYSMGKRFRLTAIAESDDEANEYMSTHADDAVIACWGGLVIMACKYAGEPDSL